jgi:ComEC/Rec2-related protein
MVWIYSISLTAGVYGWTVVAAAFPALLAVIPFLARGERRRFFFAGALCAVCFCYGALSTESFRRDYRHVRVQSGVAAGRSVELSGRVCGFPEHRLGGVRFPLKAKLCDKPVRLLVSAVAFGVGYGDSLILTGRLSAGRPERRHYLMSREACGYLRVAPKGIRPVKGGIAEPSVRRWAWRLRESIRCRLARRLGTRARLPLALSIGERGSIGKPLRSAFSRLGISHLLALSGMHLGLIAAFVLALLRFASVRGRLPLLIILTTYVCVVGEVVSLFRAYTLALVLMLAAKVERPARPVNALGTALFVLLLSRPGLAHSVAFQLSFTATLAVLLFVTRFHVSLGAGRCGRLAATAITALLASVCVQLLILPIQLRYFGGVSGLTPLTTLVYLPAIAVVMFLAGAALVVDWVAAPVSPPLFAALGAAAAGLERALFVTAGWAPDLVELPAPNLGIYYVGQCVFWLGRGGLGVFESGRPAVFAAFTGRVVAAAAICIVSF